MREGHYRGRQTNKQFAEITFYKDHERLFSLMVYTFLSHPLPEDEDNHPNLFSKNVFEIAGSYAIILISNTNHMGRFGFSRWDAAEWVSQC